MMLPFAQIQLGNPVTGLGSKQGVTSSQSQAGVGAFELLLNLMAGSASGFEMRDADSGAEAAVGAQAPTVFDLLGGQVSSQNEQLSTPAMMNSALFVLPIIGAEGQQNAQEPVSASGSLASPQTKLQFAKQSNMPASLPVAQPWLSEKIQQSIDLTPGNYQVLKSQVTDGTLNLEIVPKDKLSDPIKVSVPVDMLTNEQTSPIVTTIRPDFTAPLALKQTASQQFAASPAELESLLASVNLRELRVTRTTVLPSAEAAKSPVTIQLIGEQAGQKLVLNAKLEKSQLKARMTDTTSVVGFIADAKGNSSPTPAGAALQPTFEVPAPMVRFRPVAVALSGKAITGDAEAIEQLMTSDGQSSDHASRFEILLGTTRESQSQPTIDGPEFNQIPVRITIPTDPLPMKAIGKSIMLKIEPEHLGPARLHLSMHGDSLSAKVTVDSAQAKAAVDASLDQLTDQLHRAGVKVDFIEVNVRNGGANNQSFHRQADWFRSERQPVARFAEESLLEGVPAAQPFVRPTYIGASGVNLFA